LPGVVPGQVYFNVLEYNFYQEMWWEGAMADQISSGEYVTFVPYGGIPVTIVKYGGIFVRVVSYGGKQVTYVRSGGAEIAIPREAELPEFVKEELGY
jgi:hypothetical protein